MMFIYVLKGLKISEVLKLSNVSKVKKRMQWRGPGYERGYGLSYRLSTAILSVGLLTGLLACTACTRLNRPPTCEEQAMVKETLIETSPRAENKQPKAVPEFKFTFGGPKRERVEFPAPEEPPSDRDIYLENH